MPPSGAPAKFGPPLGPPFGPPGRPGAGPPAFPLGLPFDVGSGDLVATILHRLRLSTWVAGLSEGAGRWSVRIPTGPGGFYAALGGRLALQCDGGATHHLHPGDLAVLTGGQEHVIGDDPGSPAIPIHSLVTKEAVRSHRGLAVGQGEVNARFIGGLIALDGATSQHLRAALPRVMLVRGSARPPASLVPSTIRLLEEQARDPSQGSNAVMTQLVGLLFVEAARAHIESLGKGGSAWLQAVLDEHLGPALGLMHSAPDRAWTLSEMANEAGLSRTVFVQRFTQLIGSPPAAYLRDYRLRLAGDMLRDGKAGIGEIAARVGYASQGAFCSAFKKWASMTPGQYRSGRQAKPG